MAAKHSAVSSVMTGPPIYEVGDEPEQEVT